MGEGEGGCLRLGSSEADVEVGLRHMRYSLGINICERKGRKHDLVEGENELKCKADKVLTNRWGSLKQIPVRIALPKSLGLNTSAPLSHQMPQKGHVLG